MEREKEKKDYMKYKLIMLGDYWDEMWRRRQHLAWRFAKSNLMREVLYVERPLPITSFMKFVIGRGDVDGMERWRRVLRNRSWKMSLGDRLSVLTTFAPLPPVGMKSLFKASEQARSRWLKRHINIKNPIVWVSHPQIPVDMIKAMKPRLLWYDCTEDFSAWPELSAESVREQINSTDQWLTEHADVVTTVSSVLYKEKIKINPNTYWLPNAVDVDVFLKSDKGIPVPVELQDMKKPVLSFIGGLNDWAHDWDLLGRVAAKRKDWTILLIGGHTDISLNTKEMLNSHSNIICIGHKPYKELPNYLKYSDICFQFYRDIRSNNTRNSQKLFLYFAAGKPFISTPSADVMAYSNMVKIASTAEDFIEGVEKAIENDTEELISERKSFARNNSWGSRVEEATKILEDSLTRISPVKPNTIMEAV